MSAKVQSTITARGASSKDLPYEDTPPLTLVIELPGCQSFPFKCPAPDCFLTRHAEADPIARRIGRWPTRRPAWALYCSAPHHDLSAARQAIVTGLDVDDTAELLYRDWLRIEHAAGNRQGLHTAITRVQHVNQTLDCSLETETLQLINHLLNNPTPAARKAH
ncbi:hypothetical protein [Streptomyces sp. bgisy027]|uniref:hypothetical protein n=1 Tax=Streptomyces sp. bgisy027 TaxID=3413770 RepID=UPI003D70E9A5